MKLKFHINRSASILAGLDVPEATTLVIDVHPGELSELGRKFLAKSSFPVVHVLANAGPQEALAAIEAEAANEQTRRKALDELHAGAEAAEARREAEARAAESVRIDGLLAGTSKVTNAQPAGCWLDGIYLQATHPRYAEVLSFVEAFQAAQEAKAAAAKEESQRQAEARRAARLESGEWTMEFDAYNERRYGNYWGAKVTFDGVKAIYDFDAAVVEGRFGSAGTITIPCVPGEIIAWGQKDLRKVSGSTNEMLLMTDTGRMVSGTKSELRKMQIEFIKSKPAEVAP